MIICMTINFCYVVRKLFRLKSNSIDYNIEPIDKILVIGELLTFAVEVAD